MGWELKLYQHITLQDCTKPILRHYYVMSTTNAFWFNNISEQSKHEILTQRLDTMLDVQKTEDSIGSKVRKYMSFTSLARILKIIYLSKAQKISSTLRCFFGTIFFFSDSITRKIQTILVTSYRGQFNISSRQLILSIQLQISQFPNWEPPVTIFQILYYLFHQDKIKVA